MAKKEINFVEKEVDLKEVVNNKLKLTIDDLPMTIIFENRKQYVLINTPKGLALNKKT
jgi:hypothetical protein